MSHPVRFGRERNYDGVLLRYRDPSDDSQVEYETNSSAVNPKIIDAIGVRNFDQAYWRAWREDKKVAYANEMVSFECLPHCIVVPRLERVLVGDVTRPDMQSRQGYIVSISGTTVELSQPFEFEDGVDYSIFLQLDDGTTAAIGISAGADSRHVVLDEAPSRSLVTDLSQAMQTTYLIGEDTGGVQAPYLVMEREPSGGSTYRMTCVRYRDEFYSKDGDTPA